MDRDQRVGLKSAKQAKALTAVPYYGTVSVYLLYGTGTVLHATQHIQMKEKSVIFSNFKRDHCARLSCTRSSQIYIIHDHHHV